MRIYGEPQVATLKIISSSKNKPYSSNYFEGLVIRTEHIGTQIGIQYLRVFLLQGPER